METFVFVVALAIVVISYMLLWYGISLYTKRLDVVDTAWGLGFILVAWVSLLLLHNFGALQLVSAGLVTIWGARLALHIASRNFRKPTEDSRYQALRAKWGDATYKAFTNVFLLQGVLLSLISLPMIAIAGIHHSPFVLTYIGWFVWLGGIIFEAVADWQLDNFIRQRPKGAHTIMDKGLWKYSRHPNYFGEVVTWWGAAIVAATAGGWWGIVGALIITVLILKVSGIPPLEKHYDGNPKYEAYRTRTSVFLPLPPRERA